MLQVAQMRMCYDNLEEGAVVHHLEVVVEEDYFLGEQVQHRCHGVNWLSC